MRLLDISFRPKGTVRKITETLGHCKKLGPSEPGKIIFISYEFAIVKLNIEQKMY